MHLEIDVSGSDIFDEDYSICLSAGDGRVHGFKAHPDLIKSIQESWKNGKYTKYPYQPKNQGTFKARIYNVIIKFLLGDLFDGFDDKTIGVCFCRDFPGHEDSTKASLGHCIRHIHKKEISKISCKKLPWDSDAHRYAKMMKNDVHNRLDIYMPVALERIEPFLMWMKKS